MSIVWMERKELLKLALGEEPSKCAFMCIFYDFISLGKELGFDLDVKHMNDCIDGLKQEEVQQ